MIHKSRFIVAIGLVMAVAVAGFAFAAGSDENEAKVLVTRVAFEARQEEVQEGQLLHWGRTSTSHAVPGQQNPETEFIEYGKNIKVDLSKADTCDADLGGTTTDQAKAACPARLEHRHRRAPRRTSVRRATSATSP